MWKPRPLGSSFVQGVVLSVALGSLLAGAIVALITVILAHHFAAEQEDKHLRAAAGTLAVELLVKGYDPFYAAAEEAHELASTGIVVALFDAGQYLTGSRELPFVAPRACQSSASVRACAVPAGRWVSVAGRDPAHLNVHAEQTLQAAVTALLATSLLSTLLALVLAFRAVKPLDRLSDALQKLRDHELGLAELVPPSGVDEVDTLRAALLATFASLRQALERSRSFTGNAAHQLRTPLATLLGELDLAIEAVDGATREACLRARQQAERLAMLIDRLLILANPDESLRASATIPLQELLEDALDALVGTGRERVELASSSVKLEADSTLMLTAIVAALERTLARYERVRVHAHVHAGHARLTIEGCEHKAVRADDDICMAVVARVAALHGGHAALDSDKLELTLPALSG